MTESTLYVHDASRSLLESYRRRLPQSLLITGTSGVGLLHIAKWLAENAELSFIKPLGKKGTYDPELGTISVETIRELYQLTGGKRITPYIVIINDADRMSRGAQTAFLKLLEEPRPMVHFVLTSHAPERLLPTIRSRVQRVDIQPITLEQTKELIATFRISAPTKVTQLTYIGLGRPAEVIRLVSDDARFSKQATIMVDARDLLRAPAYAKLLTVNTYQSDRASAKALIQAMIIIVRRTLSTAPQTSLLKKLSLLLDIETQLDANMNVRLQLARLML